MRTPGPGFLEARSAWCRPGHRHPKHSGSPSDAGRIPVRVLAHYSSPDTQFATKDIAKPEKIKIPTRHGQIEALVYKPTEEDITTAAREGQLPPVHFITHGGGFIVRRPEQEDNVARYIASELGCGLSYSAAAGTGAGWSWTCSRATGCGRVGRRRARATPMPARMAMAEKADWKPSVMATSRSAPVLVAR
jgi:hypothetical protein